MRNSENAYQWLAHHNLEVPFCCRPGRKHIETARQGTSPGDPFSAAQGEDG